MSSPNHTAPSAPTKQELELIRQSTAELLDTAITRYLPRSLKRALDRLADPQFAYLRDLLDSPIRQADGTFTEPPLIRAFQYNNFPAAQALMKAGADLNVRSLNDAPALFSAVRSGNFMMVQEALSKHGKPHTVYHQRTLLQDAITFLSTFSLIGEGIWSSSNTAVSSDVIQEKLSAWFSDHDGKVKAEAIKAELADLRVVFNGNLRILTELLRHHYNIDMNAGNEKDETPLQIAQNAKSHFELFLAETGATDEDYLLTIDRDKSTEQELHLTVRIFKCNAKESIDVPVVYRLNEVVKKLKTAAAERAEREAREAHEKTLMFNAEVIEAQKFELHKLGQRVGAIDSKDARRAARLEKEIGKLQDGAKDFYNATSKSLSAIFGAFHAISTEHIQTSKNGWDRLSTLLNMAGESVPIFGVILKGAGALVSFFSDKKKLADFQQGARFIPLQYAKFAEDIALALATANQSNLADLSQEEAYKAAAFAVKSVMETLPHLSKECEHDAEKAEEALLRNATVDFRQHLADIRKVSGKVFKPAPPATPYPFDARSTASTEKSSSYHSGSDSEHSPPSSPERAALVFRATPPGGAALSSPTNANAEKQAFRPRALAFS